ncbi:MAG TPA: transcription-repair coupling factor [Chitinophagaceae bacterium]|nr:transcription-repair coupling factor [Chitinophagaceae bacterium]
MDLEDLLLRYEGDYRTNQLVQGLSMPGPAKIRLEGAAGSLPALIASAIHRHTSVNHVFILNDAEEAAYFLNDLEGLTRALDLFYFPDSFKKEGDFSQIHSSHILLRTEALLHFSDEQPRRKVLATYPQALLEKVIAPDSFQANLIHIQKGDTLKLDSLLEKLSAFGFQRTDFTYGPGEFAMRGGILDIYSFGNDHPYRVELSGDEVESIRIFDPETQLSDRKLSRVTIIPSLESAIHTGGRVALPGFLPGDTVFWVRDWRFLRDAIRKLETGVQAFFAGGSQPASGTEEELIRIGPEDFLSWDQLEGLLDQRTCVEFGSSSGGRAPDLTVHFESAPQPVFNRQFNLLISDLQQREVSGYSAFIFAENPKQLERLRAIFEDLEAGISFEPLSTPISHGFIDHDLKLVCYTDHEIFQRYHKYRVRQAYNKNRALTLKTLRELQPGDFITHIDHGIGVFSGLQKIEVNGKMQEAVRIVYRDQDLLYVNINSLHKISKYIGKEGTAPRISKLGSDAWEKLKEKTKSQVKDIARDLIKLYAERKAKLGFSHTPDTYLQTELEASFLYEDTPDQAKSTADVKRDMESPHPMDRLVCGDVGFGKTEIAVRAAFKTVADDKQAAILVPTTILAFQHFKTFQDRLKDFPCTVDYISRFKSARQKKETLERLREGKLDIIIGTHALLGKEVKFKDLGLLVIDEEQKFGVSSKEKLKHLKVNVDTLTLTATPIPRTLQFSLMGARDLSIINTPPPNRQAIQTELQTFDETRIRDAIYFEAERGGQVFFIHNRVGNLPEMAALLRGLCPDLTVSYAHGKMEGHQLEKAVLDFIEQKTDVLTCTNIIESGVDIPNANTIIINNAHQFGLSDLHQLRGRVGRSNKKAFCYLLSPPVASLADDSRKRLQTLEQHSDLGSGFQIAMRDLDIRGAGNMLGAEQSGFIAEIGFDTYHKILDEAIRELKQTDFRELFRQESAVQSDYVRDCTIDTDLEILIPDDYVGNTQERFSLYQQLDNLKGDEELNAFARELEDRFGPMPSQAADLFRLVRCRKMAVALGFEKMILREQVLRCYFVSNPDSSYYESALFRQILNFIQTGVNHARLKQVGRNFMLVVRNIRTAENLLVFILSIREATSSIAVKS